MVVSRDPQEPDSLELSFDQSYFKDPISDFDVNGGEPLVIPLPRQLDKDMAGELAGAVDTAISGSNAVMTANTVINIILGSSLKLLWGMINTFQFVVFFTEW